MGDLSPGFRSTLFDKLDTVFLSTDSDLTVGPSPRSNISVGACSPYSEFVVLSIEGGAMKLNFRTYADLDPIEMVSR